MPSARRLFDALRAKVLTPKVSEPELEACLRRIHETLPVPVFWLLGKAQSGKTSLIRALTLSSNTEIGNGFRPCTRTARLYPYPNQEEHFVQFLDTRGLGEVDYDPSEDMHVLENQAHLLIVVIKALDHAQASVLAPLKKIRKAHPRWPVIVVQTALHEGYPSPATPHVVPYPYGEPPYPSSVPTDLARSLAAQRETFAGMNARFVPVDFTLPEDGYEPLNYGLDQLWTAIEEAVPLGLRGILHDTREARRPLRDVYLRAARPHVLSYSVAAGAAAAGVPLPVIDVPLVLAIQAKLFHTIASIYGQPMSSQRMAEIGSTLGVGFLTRLAGRSLLKLIPGFGSAVSGLYAAASTYALGRTLCAYFSYILEGDVPDPTALRRLYAQEFREGKARLGQYISKVGKPPPEPGSS
ncbi:MAG: DUF697 domain-containing protein [Pirellulales bacterium]